MSQRPALLLLNLPLPGSGLLLSGRAGVGVCLLLPALFNLTLAGLAAIGAASSFARQIIWWCLAIHVGLAVGALAAQWLLERQQPIDPKRIRELHRACAGHYLRNELTQAKVAAEALCREAPREPGAWRLLELVAEAGRDERLARRARRRRQRMIDPETGLPAWTGP